MGLKCCATVAIGLIESSTHLSSEVQASPEYDRLKQHGNRVLPALENTHADDPPILEYPEIKPLNNRDGNGKAASSDTMIPRYEPPGPPV